MRVRGLALLAVVLTVSAAGMELLGHRLRWMDPIDAFHAPTVLLAGVLAWR